MEPEGPANIIVNATELTTPFDAIAVVEDLRTIYQTEQGSLQVVLSPEGIVLDAINHEGEVVATKAMTADEWWEAL